MRHVILTCKNHPGLRWSTKEIAVTNGRYNGSRNIFFQGEPLKNPDGSPKMFSDGSGLDCEKFRSNGTLVEECTCVAADLIVAPEDNLVKRDV